MAATIMDDKWWEGFRQQARRNAECLLMTYEETLTTLVAGGMSIVAAKQIALVACAADLFGSHMVGAINGAAAMLVKYREELQEQIRKMNDTSERVFAMKKAAQEESDTIAKLKRRISRLEGAAKLE